MIKTITTGWSFVRGLRLVLGAVILVQSIVTKQYAIGLFGGLFMFQALLNMGCGMAGGCGMPTRTTNLNGKLTEGEVEYEEVKGK